MLHARLHVPRMCTAAFGVTVKAEFPTLDLSSFAQSSAALTESPRLCSGFDILLAKHKKTSNDLQQGPLKARSG